MYKFGADVFFRSCETVRLDLLDILGIDYIIDHFGVEIKKNQDEDIYKQYIAMCLYAISDGRMTKTLPEIIEAAKEPPQKTLSGKETAQVVADTIGFKINWGK